MLTISKQLIGKLKFNRTKIGKGFECMQFATKLKNRFVKMESSKFDMKTPVYPTPGSGHDFKMQIFGLTFSVEDINNLQECIWTNKSFLPRKSASPLPESTGLKVLSDVATKMAIVLDDNSTAGLLAQNKLRETVDNTLNNEHFVHTMRLLKSFKTEGDFAKKQEIGQYISDVAFFSQWLIRGYLFEGKLHYEMFCSDVIPEPLSKIAFAANAALGRHQIEFVYDDYTLKAANFPPDFDVDAIDYDNPSAILDAIASIKTPVGFNDVKGGSPEHNFRHNHSLMEAQMISAFKGVEQILQGDKEGWKAVVESARRANKVFKTMLQNTPAHSYPSIRLPIKGVRGACGTVYQKHGVFYEGVGNDTFVKAGKTLTGVFVDNEWGQTGANSSMYKYFDILIGVANVRQAFGTDPIMILKMQQVYEGSLDSGELGVNPIDSMQRAFDLFTRPVKHMKILVDTQVGITTSKILDDKNTPVLLERLRLAYWVAEHRITHGQYVLKAIYQTEPIGGQSRADGTGGSTPPFLKLFLDQTIGPGRSLIISLLLQNEKLSADERAEVAKISAAFDEFERRMCVIRDKGQELEYDEKVTNHH